MRVMATARSACAASFAASMVHSFANSMAFLIASASRLPAVAPLTIEAVMPSIPDEAARADFVAAASMPDRFALTLLMDWFALSTSTVTTSSSWLLFAMGVRSARDPTGPARRRGSASRRTRPPGYRPGRCGFPGSVPRSDRERAG